MSIHPNFKPFNFEDWIDNNRQYLKPPVSNKLVFEEAGMVVQVIGGPNQRVDFHDDPVQEFFYQLTGDMILKVCEENVMYDVPIKQGEVFMLPAHMRHSPQRPVPGSIGLVVESPRIPGMLDGFEWFCFDCANLVHRVEVPVNNIVDDLPPLFDAFYRDEDKRKCSNCGAIHPGKEPPEGWVDI